MGTRGRRGPVKLVALFDRKRMFRLSCSVQNNYSQGRTASFPLSLPVRLLCSVRCKFPRLSARLNTAWSTASRDRLVARDTASKSATIRSGEALRGTVPYIFGLQCLDTYGGYAVTKTKGTSYYKRRLRVAKKGGYELLKKGGYKLLKEGGYELLKVGGYDLQKKEGTSY